jgi:hypothetical protein
MKVKLSLFLIVSILFSSITSSQIIYINNNSPEKQKGRSISAHHSSSMFYYMGFRNLNKLHVKEQNLTELRKKSKRWYIFSNTTTKFDTSGSELEYRIFIKNKENSFDTRVFNINKQVTEYKRRYRGKPISHYKYAYDELGQLVSMKSFYKGKCKSSSFAVYKDSLITSQYAYGKDSTKLNYQLNYYYYPNGDKKRTEYFKKGKLKKTWSYTCDEEGEEVKAKKDKTEDTKVCQLKQYNADSTYVLINRLMNEEGKFSKVRKTFNKHDKLILYESFNLKNELFQKYEYEYNKANKRTKRIRYHYGKYVHQVYQLSETTYLNDTLKIEQKETAFHKKSGAVKWAHEYTFNSAGKTTKSIMYGKNKTIERIRKHVYNEDNQKISTEIFGENGEFKSKIEYTYNKNGILEETNTYDKDLVLVKSVIQKYQYY